MKVIIKPSTRKNKKLMAVFYDKGQKIKSVHFGAKGYSDFTKHKDPKRKKNYLARHSNENWNDFMSAGSLSRWILWNKKTLRSSIKDYKKKFNLS